MLKVSKRGGFSDRNGIKTENIEIQLYDFDERTRVQFVNLIGKLYEVVYENTYYGNGYIQELFRYIYGDVYSQTINVLKYYKDTTFFKDINETIMCDDYDAVLTLMEAFAQYWNRMLKEQKGYFYGKDGEPTIYEFFNVVFEKEYVGYRFINGKISPISDEQEVNSIEEALRNKYEPVREHIAKANLLLADRENPDYENSIKESISAVEAICEIITGIHGKEATMGKMLKKLEDSGVVIHAALQSAFSVLYGYTSDASGIRHAKGIGGPTSTFEEAKFMLVSCCAFINYLMGVSASIK